MQIINKLTLPCKYMLIDLTKFILNKNTTDNNLLSGSIPSEVEALEAYNFGYGTSQVKLNRILFLKINSYLYK